jgi:hypothetical protein
MSWQTEGPLFDEILAAERQVWVALVAGDAAADLAALAGDFLGLYASGMAGREAHAEQLADGPVAESYRIEDAQLLPLAPDHALLCYRAHFTWPGEPAERDWLISSLWRRRAGAWENVFSQDTEAAHQATSG